MRKFLIFIIISYIPTIVISQIKIDLQGGMGFNQINFEPAPPSKTTERKVAYMLGVSSKYFFNKNLGISTGIYLERKNYNYKSFLNFSSSIEDNADKIELNGEFKLFYAEIPLDFEIRKQIGKYYLSTLSGIYYSYNIIEKGTVKAENDIEFETEFSDYFTKHDIGYNISLGVGYKPLSVQLYFKHNLNNLLLNDNNYQAKFNEFGILLSYNLLTINLRNNEK